MRKPSDDPDKILDAALASYADPVESIDPSLLAARVISIIQARQTRRWWRWGLAASVAVLAGLLILAVLPGRPPKFSTIPLSSQAVQTLGIPSPQRALIAHAACNVLSSSRTHVTRHIPPKLDQFPTPEPLSEQEKLLVVFVNRTSSATQQAVAQASEPPEPIKIAALTVPSIDQIAKEIQNLGEHDEEQH